MASFQTTRLSYKNDDFGNPLFAKVCWEANGAGKAKPIIFMLHAGGFVVGSANIIPQAQISYLCSHNCLVVIPNYRLAPQKDALRGAFADTESAFDWGIQTLPALMRDTEGIAVDDERVAVMGHSAGGTLALHLAARSPTQVRAVTAFYPSLFMSDLSTSMHKPYTSPPFGTMPDFNPTDEDWKSIAPSDMQLSECPLALPGTPPPPRNRWQGQLLKEGRLAKAVCLDEDYAAIEPCPKFGVVGAAWPPTLFVQGDKDDLPGSGIEHVERAVNQLRNSGAKTVDFVTVKGETHMFDLPPTVGTTDMGPKWEAVKKGLDLLIERM